MQETADFRALVARVRAGDAEAARELVERHAPLIRREVRLCLQDERLRRAFDSLDVCQSVLGSFFVRAAVGEYDLDEPQDLVRLLVSIARNKTAQAARKEARGRRDYRRRTPDDEPLAQAPAAEESPSQVVVGAELLALAQRLLSPEERQLAELRRSGCEWAEIAERLGGTPQARRVQLARAVERVLPRLGLEHDEGA